MINQLSLAQISQHRSGEQFIRPAYGSYCFAHIPDTIRYLFNRPARSPLPADTLPAWGGYDQVVFFFIDAFGWRFFEKYSEHPFLRTLIKDGIVSQMTSMFPSTTSAHTTCIHTGLSVPQSGVFEWFYYEPVVGEVISPLLFSLAGDKVNGKDIREGLVQMGYTARQIFPRESIYEDLALAGVKSYVHNYREYARSSFSLHTNRGAEILPYSYWTEALANLAQMLENARQPSYHFLYYAAADSLMHQYGPESPQVETEILSFLDQMQRFFARLKSKRTLLILSADHGQAETDPTRSIAINIELPGIEKYLQHSPAGRPIRFGGSPRDLFLYAREETLPELQERIQEILAGRAEVFTTARLITDGHFGIQPPSQRLLDRMGSLVILPYRGEAVYWYEKGRFEQRFYGHHGGLTAQEMLIPLLALETI